MPISYVGDEGTVIEVDTQNDLTEATDLEILILRPDESILTKIATIPEGLDASDGKISCVSEASDFNTPGTYKVQPRITGVDVLHRGRTDTFEVRESFK